MSAVIPPGGSRPRVLFVIGQLDIGGAERHLAQLAPALRAAGVDCMVFVLKPGGALATVLDAAGVPVLAHPNRRAGALGLLQAAWRLREILRRERPHIVHFFLPAAYIVGAFASMSLPVQRVMSRRSLAHYQARYPGIRKLEALLHRRMAVVLGNSRAVARELRDEGVPPGRLGVIYNGVEDRAGRWPREDARASLGIPAQALVFVTVANLIGYKGHADLLDALASASPGLPDGWLLLVVGRDDGIGDALRARALHLGIAAHVRWCGQTDEVGPLLAAADVGVLASHEEGFSNAVLEGMAAGLPMVVTDVGGNAEAVPDGLCGRVVPPRNPPALAAALAELAGSAGLRVRMGATARARAGQSFTVDACVAQYAALYRNLVNGSPAPLPPGTEFETDGSP